MIKAVIFDFFGVLVTEGFKRFCDMYFPGDKQKRRQAVGLVTGHDAGAVSTEQYISGLADLAGVNQETVVEHMGDNKPNLPLLSYIKKELKPRYKLGVLSNSGDDYLNQILDSKDVAIFDDIILSYRHGMVKPQAEIFEFAAKRLGVSAAECVFIDDSPNHCRGAETAGMQAVLYQDFGQMKTELEKLLSASSNN